MSRVAADEGEVNALQPAKRVRLPTCNPVGFRWCWRYRLYATLLLLTVVALSIHQQGIELRHLRRAQWHRNWTVTVERTLKKVNEYDTWLRQLYREPNPLKAMEAGLDQGRPLIARNHGPTTWASWHDRELGIRLWVLIQHGVLIKHDVHYDLEDLKSTLPPIPVTKLSDRLDELWLRLPDLLLMLWWFVALFLLIPLARLRTAELLLLVALVLSLSCVSQAQVAGPDLVLLKTAWIWVCLSAVLLGFQLPRPNFRFRFSLRTGLVTSTLLAIGLALGDVGIAALAGTALSLLVVLAVSPDSGLADRNNRSIWRSCSSFAG